MRSRSDIEMRNALGRFVERMASSDMLRARDSLIRWVQSVLQYEFHDMTLSLEEGPEMTILFNRRFKTYEDLLEYEAIERGREQGAAMALQEVVSTFVAECRDELAPDLDEKIAQAKVAELKGWIKLLASGAKPQQIFSRT